MRAFGRARGRVRACSRAVVALTAAALVAGLAAAGPAAAAQPPPHSSVLLAQTSEGLPRIVGEARVGEVLSVDLSDISGTVATMAVKWWRTVGVSSTEQVAEASTYTLTDADLGEQLSVLVVLTDGRILASSFTAAVIAADATTNTAATGEPAITGNAQVNSVLTASPGTIDDDDGLSGVAYRYQWIRVGVGDIAGATSSTYTLKPEDEGKQIAVRASFTDDGGNPESRTSDTTATVGPAPSTSSGTTGGGSSRGGGGGGAPPPEPEPQLRDYFVDDDGNVHEADINKIAAAAITVGCNPPDDRSTGNHYCPDQPVTRAQMASLLARALDLPDTGTDYFVDDDGNVHEADINKIAAAAITVGCNPPDDRSTGNHYCPDQPVTRAQMASLLARALDLPDTGTDYFVDDDGNVHEADINKIAAAAITVGCNPPDDRPAGDRYYCPDQPVTRAEMASLLARALDL